jgi:TRAP-type mannitol/chloroaromatic compound transport system permease large subunit
VTQPFVVLIGGTIGSLYLGWATPTEAAAVGCVLALLGTLPYHVIMFVLLGVLMVWPDLALWLPNNMTGK